MSLPTAKPGDRVLEITHDTTGEVGHRSIVTGQSERSIERLERGMMINLDHANWSVVDRVIPADQPEPAGTEA